MRLKPNNPRAMEGRSIHPKRVIDPATYKGNILKSVANNKKLGNGNNYIVKGKWRHMPMLSLTLEERATCPPSCHHWFDCYGNNMAFAQRFQHGPELESRLDAELQSLSVKHRQGFVIRLHVLGDFYSLEYAEFWQQMLVKYPNLYVFGYTARGYDAIGQQLAFMNAWFPTRCWIRFSKKESSGPMTAVETPNSETITCPEQTGKTEACVTCGLCWSIKKPIHFITH